MAVPMSFLVPGGQLQNYPRYLLSSLRIMYTSCIPHLRRSGLGPRRVTESGAMLSWWNFAEVFFLENAAKLWSLEAPLSFYLVCHERL